LSYIPFIDRIIIRAEVMAILKAEELQHFSQIDQKSVNIDFPEKFADEKK